MREVALRLRTDLHGWLFLELGMVVIKMLVSVGVGRNIGE